MREQITIVCGCKFVRELDKDVVNSNGELACEVVPCDHHEGIQTLTPMQLGRFIDTWPPSEFGVERAWLRTQRSKTP